MPYILVRHTVEDFAKWKSVYDEHASMRAEHGAKQGQAFRNSEKDNEVIVLIEWDSLENARKFAESDEIKQAMQKGGVTGQPEIFYLNEV